MVTFTTPFAGTADARNALKCALTMLRGLDAFIRMRVAIGQPAIQAGFGLHYGTVVLVDIGANRLEAATRAISCALLASDSHVAQARTEGAADALDQAGLQAQPPTSLAGLENAVAVWSARGLSP
jgi:adenylate cyclase